MTELEFVAKLKELGYVKDKFFWSTFIRNGIRVCVNPTTAMIADTDGHWQDFETLLNKLGWVSPEASVLALVREFIDEATHCPLHIGPEDADGCCFVRARYTLDDSKRRDRFCHLFVTLLNENGEGGEKAWYAANEEVIDPEEHGGTESGKEGIVQRRQEHGLCGCGE
jgi:hypothetical protein